MSEENKKIETLKENIAKMENSLGSPLIPDALKEGMRGTVAKLKAELATLESKVEKKVEQAENKVEDAKTKVEDAQQKVKEAETNTEKKEAQKELKEAKVEVKEAKEEVKEVKEEVKEEIKEIQEKTENAEKKIHGGKRMNAGRPKMFRPERPKMPRGGYRPNAGRPTGRKASSTTKIRKPAGVQVERARIVKGFDRWGENLTKRDVFVRKSTSTKDRKITEKKVNKARAFGVTIEYKNNAEFCKKLISAFKMRKVASRSKGKKRTKPVFGVITSQVKNIVSKALHNVSKKQIEKNPKEFLAKAQRLEKSAIKFLNDFKSILGSDYNKSSITREFGELERSIKAFVSKYSK